MNSDVVNVLVSQVEEAALVYFNLMRNLVTANQVFNSRPEHVSKFNKLIAHSIAKGWFTLLSDHP